MKPALPIPDTTTLPSQAKMRATASLNAPSMRAQSCSMAEASTRKTPRAYAAASAEPAGSRAGPGAPSLLIAPEETSASRLRESLGILGRCLTTGERSRHFLNEPSFRHAAQGGVERPTRPSGGHVQAKTKENDKRSRILDAAVRVFAERGFFGATVAEIARAAGVADGTIYLYFKSKDDVLLRLFDEKMTELLAEAKAAASQDGSAAAR